MTEDVILKLPAPLKKNICTLEKSSMDTTNKKTMCNSPLKVVNFDKIPNEYSRGKRWIGVPKSNDALYIDINGKWHFIEFKNGTVRKDEIYRKLYDSLIMLIEWNVIPDFDFVRKNIDYILVYNNKKYERTPDSQARSQTYHYIVKLARQEERLFDIDKFEGYLFNETHTYTPDLFEEYFIKPREIEEQSTQ